MYRLWRRYISVALFLKSPSAGVTRYPCPVEPGLSSCTAFRRIHAAVWLTRQTILRKNIVLVQREFVEIRILLRFFSFSLLQIKMPHDKMS